MRAAAAGAAVVRAAAVVKGVVYACILANISLMYDILEVEIEL